VKSVNLVKLNVISKSIGCITLSATPTMLSLIYSIVYSGDSTV